MAHFVGLYCIIILKLTAQKNIKKLKTDLRLMILESVDWRVGFGIGKTDVLF
jgi:hypothetical protein